MRCWLSDMAAWVNIIGRKVSLTSANQAGGSGVVLRFQLQFQGILRQILGSKEHVDWLKIDLNVAEIITVQDYKHKKN